MRPFVARRRGATMRVTMRLAWLALVVAPGVALAQSNLSVQGYGFPTGQLSTRANGTGGSIGEMDPLSPINPAALGLLPSRILFFQIEPEFRTVKTTGGAADNTTTARYPVVFAAIPVAGKWVVSLGSSTLLDRTSSTSFNTTETLDNGESVGMRTTYRIDGAMNDVQLATAWTPLNWLRVGLGAHAIAGHNLVAVTQAFDDSTAFAPFAQSRVLGFGGAAVSGGIQVVSKRFVAAGSARIGGGLNVSAGDTLISSARVPNRFGVSLGYIGIPNSTIAIRTSRDSWSSLGDLGSPQLHPVDAWDTSIGADVGGPRLGSQLVFLRAGFRVRTLPFQASDETVSEKSVTAGIGTAFASNRVLADFAVIRASRSANLSASEHAWTLSFGIAVRP
jgi:hypothetical protein